MQRLVQERFLRQGANLQAVMELNTLDAFRGVVRQGELIALLPQSALVDARQDATLAIRVIDSTPAPGTPNLADSLGDPSLSRQVVMVTTRDRLLIPPIQHFCQMVRELVPMQFAGAIGNTIICSDASIPVN